MALAFYVHGQDPEFDKHYSAYTNNQNWNAAWPGESTGFAASLSIARTGQGLQEILTCAASKFMLGKAKIKLQSGGSGASAAVTLLELVNSAEATLIVLKGVHQESGPHISLAYAGWIYHVNVKSGRLGQANLFTVTGISEGSEVRDAPGGWKAAKS